MQPSPSPRSDRGIVRDSVANDDVTRLHMPTRTTQSLSIRGFVEHFVKAEAITLNHRGVVAIQCEAGVLLASSVEPGHAQLDYDDAVMYALLRVDDAAMIDDGALIGVGRRWFRFNEGDQTRPPCLQLLGPDGDPRIMVTMRGHSITLGHAVGDLILPAEDGLAAIHLQITRRGGKTWLDNLAGPDKTWLLVPPKQHVPADGIIAVGDRLLQLRAPSPVCFEETMRWGAVNAAVAHRGPSRPRCS